MVLGTLKALHENVFNPCSPAQVISGLSAYGFWAERDASWEVSLGECVFEFCSSVPPWAHLEVQPP